MSNTTTAFRPMDTTATLRPVKLPCPRCQQAGRSSPPLAVAYAGKIEFHRCQPCGGAWFYEKDADAALRAAGSAPWPHPSAKIDAATVDATHMTELACPCCGGALVAVRDRHGSGACVRRCLVCYGSWMDYADIQAAAEASKNLLSRLKNMFASK